MVNSILEIAVLALWERTSVEKFTDTKILASEFFSDTGCLAWFRAGADLEATLAWENEGEVNMDASDYLGSMINATSNFVAWTYLFKTTLRPLADQLGEDFFRCVELLCLKSGGHSSSHPIFKIFLEKSINPHPLGWSLCHTKKLLREFDTLSLDEMDAHVTQFYSTLVNNSV